MQRNNLEKFPKHIILVFKVLHYLGPTSLLNIIPSSYPTFQSLQRIYWSLPFLFSQAPDFLMLFFLVKKKISYLPSRPCSFFSPCEEFFPEPSQVSFLGNLFSTSLPHPTFPHTPDHQKEPGTSQAALPFSHCLVATMIFIMPHYCQSISGASSNRLSVPSGQGFLP